MTIAIPSLRAITCTPQWVRNDLWRRARAVPSLDLRFADSKSLVDAVTGQNLITFTRSSNGTYVGSDGLLKTATTNEPRFDHNPTTGESLGLLVEEQRTNLTTFSEQLDNARWQAINATLSANTSETLAPDGSNTAEKLLEQATTTSHGLSTFNAYTLTAGSVYTASIFVKGINKQFVQLVFDDNITTSGGYANFNLSTGVMSASANYGTGSGIGGSITRYPNGWYRLSVTSTAGTTSTFGRFAVNSLTSGTSSAFPGFTGSTSNGYYLWGAQLELGSFPTSYIPTTGTAATRSADVASISSGLSVASLRALYAQFISPASGTRGIISLNDNTANQRIALNTSGTDPIALVVDGGVIQANIDAGTVTANVRGGLAARFTTNDFAASFNGGAVVTDTSGTLPTVDRLFIGRSQAGEYLNAPIARLIGWREELPDSALRALTQ